MRKLTIFILSTAVLVLLAAGGFYLFAYLDYTGTFDTRYTRAELTQNFVEHEADFKDVVDYFNSHLPTNGKYHVEFSTGRWNRYSLYLSPVSGLINEVTGGSHQLWNTAKLDTALHMLGWTNETLVTLRDKLAKTKCDHIMNTEVYGGCHTELSPRQSGWGFFSYMVYDAPMSDTLINRVGKPIRSSGFGSRVRLSYSSAL